MAETILEMIPSIVGSLAWPVAAVVIFCLLRRNLQKLIDRLETAETKWGNLNFSRGIEDIKSNFDRIEEEPAATELEEVGTPDKLEFYSPVTEVMSAWADVERLCQELLAKHKVAVPRTFRALGSRLKRNQLIDPEHVDILGKLRQTRNIAVHQGPISSSDAQEYVALANRMIEYLNGKIEG